MDLLVRAIFDNSIAALCSVMGFNQEIRTQITDILSDRRDFLDI